jgi:hypothetical protein
MHTPSSRCEYGRHLTSCRSNWHLHSSLQAAGAAALYRGKEERLKAAWSEWAEAHEATVRAEIANVESEAEKRAELARRSMGFFNKLNAAVKRTLAQVSKAPAWWW